MLEPVKTASGLLGKVLHGTDEAIRQMAMGRFLAQFCSMAKQCPYEWHYLTSFLRTVDQDNDASLRHFTAGDTRF